MPHVIVPIAALDGSARQALAHAQAVGQRRGAVVAVHVATDGSSAQRLRQDWRSWCPDAELVILEAPRERPSAPLLAYLDLLRSTDATEPVMVVVGPDEPLSHALRRHPGVVLETPPHASPGT